ncbi:ABC transporter substrate-binding protein [Leucobacter sp. CSA1]|uniref:ABC transporter substrate-binding protein n=1 Tax=Leucobacter chromiisoli TaxID=2796471 RepID=A0A934UTX7_9MICO|nr:ABC transporter substrate-binding protein [Leucobacter chromiisoli]MBK0418894.1 ABC transporter substrate-binding protein [Leucobacter chromiisoli]
MRHRIAHTRTGRVIAAASAVALMTGLAACSSDGGGDDAPAADGGAPETSELLVGIVPVIDHASVFVAIDQGFFEEEGLDVTAQPAQGGAAAVPAMISGEMQAAFATYPSFLLSENSGIGIDIVAEGVRGTEETAGVYVAPDSDIDAIADLEGKKIAVNTLNNTGDLTIKTLLDDAGVDPDSVEFIELAFPDMVPTLSSGGVDAAWLVEPFQTGGLEAGMKKVFSTYEGPTEGIPVSGVGMTREFVEKNPNTVAAFSRALAKANDLLAEDPSLAVDLLPTYSEVSEEVASKLQLPQWTAGGPDAEEISRWNQLMEDQGVLSAPVDVESMVRTGD